MAEQVNYMPSIVSSGPGDTDPTTKRLIRSHARRNKLRNGRRLNETRPIGLPTTTGRRTPRIRSEEVVEKYQAPVCPYPGSDLVFVEFSDRPDAAILLSLTKGWYRNTHITPTSSLSLTILAAAPLAMRFVFPLVAAILFQENNE